MGCGTVSIRSLCMELCTPRLSNFIKVDATIFPVLLFGFPSVTISIYPLDFNVQVSNERKQISDQIYNSLFFSRGYTPG